MALTNEQRENRALYNLERNESLTLGQLYCASVNRAAVSRLANAGVIEPTGVVNMRTGAPHFRITYAGLVLLTSRINTGRASTI